MQVITGARVFDGRNLLDDVAILCEGGRILDMCAAAQAPKATVTLQGGVLAPGFLDLQANGGAGLMVGVGTDVPALRKICAAHLTAGTAGVLPTLITDTPEVTQQVIAAGIAAQTAQVPGFMGLHLEGPHLDPKRKGAHDPRLIRPMGDDDLAILLQAKAQLQHLMVTLAPEAATADQIGRLAQAGIVVSLGHSDCNHSAAQAAIAAGAGCATHLFNAMSQLGNREPGLVGTVLGGDLPCGLIADGIHVDPAVMRIAFAAKPRGIFLVTDCMAFLGWNLTEMTLNGRRILRGNGRLSLEDGTLAGADLTLPQALRVVTERVGLSVERALSMVTRVPADLIGASDRGRIAPGARADLVHLDDSFAVRRMWQAGEEVTSGQREG